MALWSEHKPLIDHSVDWRSNHRITCKASIDSTTNTIESKFLKITIKQETNGGKKSRTFGSVVINVASFANNGNKECRRRYILASQHKNVRQTNSLLQISIQMCQTFGDPCFRVPEEDCANCLDISPSLGAKEESLKEIDKQHTIDVVLATDDNNDDPDEYQSRQSSYEHNGRNLAVPTLVVMKGHRRHFSANAPLWLQPRNSGPIFIDDMGLKKIDDKRYHSSINCFEQRDGCNKYMPIIESPNFTNKQDLINSTRGSRADIVDSVLRNCFDKSKEVLE